MVHRDLASKYNSQELSNQLKGIRQNISDILQQFQKLKKFINSKDRKNPSTFVVFTADKNNSKAKDAVTNVTKSLYELFLQPTNISAISHFLQNKVCDLYLICESCNQIQGRITVILTIIIIIIMNIYR